MTRYYGISYFLLFLVVWVNSKSSDWLHCTVLDGDEKYHVCWKTLVTSNGHMDITFGVDVQTHGYVGLGLSPNGGMAGSDIVTGWIIDGKTYFQDRHGVGNTVPEIDSSSDWELLHGSENDTHTSLVFRRKLDTCDGFDWKIDDSTTRLIYAYSEEDPSSEIDLRYHGSKRGAKSVLLLQSPRKDQNVVDESQLLYWDVLSPNFTITSSFTTMYWCKIYKVPVLSVKHHIVKVEPLIQRGHEALVHHLLMYECIGANSEDYEPHLDREGHQCYHPNMPDEMKKCEGVTLSWAIGGENLILPEHVGLPLKSNSYYMLEIHYDNPQRHHGLIDNSGFRIYYTPKLRKYDAGNLMIGASTTPRSFVPPKSKEFTISGHSNPHCLDPVLPKTGIKILGIFLHAHLLGRHLKVRHFRNKKEIQPLAEDKNYDFNYQEYRFYTKEVEFFPGDQFTMECTYDSSDRTTATFGGLSTREEMCLGFIFYYPKIKIFGDTSVPKYDEINAVLNTSFSKEDVKNGNFEKSLLEFNWENINIETVENTLLYSQQDTYCYLGDGNKDSVKYAISYPPDFEPYEEELTCIQNKLHNECATLSIFGITNRNISFLYILYILIFYILIRSF